MGVHVQSTSYTGTYTCISYTHTYTYMYIHCIYSNLMVQMLVDPVHVQSISYIIHCTYIHCIWHLFFFWILCVDACRHMKIDLYVLESVNYRVHYYANDGVHVKCISYILHSYIHFIWFLFCLILCLLPSLVPAPVFL